MGNYCNKKGGMKMNYDDSIFEISQEDKIIIENIRKFELLR